MEERENKLTVATAKKSLNLVWDKEFNFATLPPLARSLVTVDFRRGGGGERINFVLPPFPSPLHSPGMMNSNPSFPAFTEGEGEGRTGGKSKEGKFFQPLLVIGRSREGVGWGGEGGTNLSQSRETTSEVIVRKRRSRRKREMNNEVWAGAEEDEGGGE